MARAQYFYDPKSKKALIGFQTVGLHFIQPP